MENSKTNGKTNSNVIDAGIMLQALSQELTEANVRVANYRALYMQEVLKNEELLKEITKIKEDIKKELDKDNAKNNK